MKKKILLFVIMLAMVLAGCSSGVNNESVGTKTKDSNAHHHSAGQGSASNGNQPYTGNQNRKIKALSSEEVDNLLKGKGAGYALAAELNQYPGPKHVIDLSSELKLTPEQEESLRKQIPLMEQEAIEAGRELLALETQLDQAFQKGTVSDDELQSLTQDIADAEGKLRYTHLKYHLETRDLLTNEQIVKYDELRGYLKP